MPTDSLTSGPTPADETPTATSADPQVTRGVAQRGAITLLGTLVGGVLMFGNEILAARFLGLTLYGCYALAIVFARIGEEVSMFGFGVGVLHFVPIYLRKDDKPRLVGAILLGMAFPVVIGALLVAAMWFAAPFLAEHVLHEPDAVSILRLFAFAIPFIGLSEINGRITRGFGHAIYHVAVREVIPRVAYFVLLLALVLLGANRLWIAAAYGLPYVLSSAVGVLSILKLTGPEAWKVRPIIPFREMYSYSIASYVSVLLALVMGATDYVLIGVLGTPEEAGLYRGALQYANTLVVLIHAFAASTVHLYPVLIKEGRREELDRVYRTASKSVNILAGPLCALIALNHLDFLGLLGDQFPAAGGALLVLLAANLIRSSTGIAPYVLLVSGRQRVETMNVIVGIAVTILLDLWLIPRYGIMGAAVTTLVSNAVLAALRITQLRRFWSLRTLTVDTLGPIVVSAVVGGVVWGLSTVSGVGDGAGPVWLAIRFAAGGLLFLLGMAAYVRFSPRLGGAHSGSVG